jgi:hypothetical protein
MVMKRTQSLWHSAAWLAMCCMCLPPSLVLGSELTIDPGSQAVATAPSPAERRPKTAIHDVALRPRGLLVGQIVDPTMAPLVGKTVEIRADGQTAATTTTDANGVFAVSGLRGGVHQVIAGDSMELCRLWTPGTAPPQARSNLRLIPGQDTVVRGQWGAPSPYDTMMGWATNPWVIGGVVATAIAVPIVLHNIDDDDDNGS